MDQVASQVKKYMDDEAKFALFDNGSCLMLKDKSNIENIIQGAMKEARKILDFKVYPMNDGDFLVFFASPLLVYVGKEEFWDQRDEIERRKVDLKFKSEELIALGDRVPDDMLVGLYARGKLQNDAWSNFKYKIINPG
ncbi:MAG: hypothetical protein OEY19_05330 [Gammaproteobacteria bacterium]|nr:hypothetical protein [Gammaproteobacteria bacterium]